MKKKGAELISIFIISMLLFCSFSFPVYASSNEWGYNDSYVNSVSSENKQLFFIPPAPASNYSDYMIVYWDNDYYLVLGNGNYLIYGNGIIQYPSSVVCYKYISQSNNWLSCDFPRYVYDMPAFDRSLVVIDVTSNVQFWSVGTPIQDMPIVNHTGYRLYWDLSVILNNIIIWVKHIVNIVLSHVLLRIISLSFLGGELLLFIILLIRRVGDLHEKGNM